MKYFGSSRFNACELKSVTYHETGKNEVNVSPGVEATLRCPKLGNASISETDTLMVDKRGAYRKVGRTASKTLCNACPFVGMSPTQANNLQREIASSKMEALQTEAMAAQMQAAHDRGEDIITDSPVWRNPAVPQITATPGFQELPPSPEQ